MDTLVLIMIVWDVAANKASQLDPLFRQVLADERARADG